MKNANHWIALGMSIALFGYGPSYAASDPRAVVLGLLTGAMPGAETVAGNMPELSGTWSAKANPGDTYTLDMTKATDNTASTGGAPAGPKSLRFIIDKVADPCTYDVQLAADGQPVAAYHLDFRKFGGVVSDVRDPVTPTPYSVLTFRECGAKENGVCREAPRILWSDGSDSQKQQLESYAKMMREDICKPD